MIKAKAIKWYLEEYFLRRNSRHIDNYWKMKIGKFLNRYQRGNGDINLFKDILIILGIGGLATGVKLDWSYWIFVVLAIIWFIGCYTLGFWDEFFGFWGKQSEHSSGSEKISPVTAEMRENIRKIREKLGI